MSTEPRQLARTLALFVAALVFAGAASAAPIGFNGVLALQLGALEPIVSAAAGTADVQADLSFTLPADVFSLSGSLTLVGDPSGPGAIVGAVVTDARNTAGAFATVSGSFLGLMPLTSIAGAALFIDAVTAPLVVNIPLSVVGGDGSAAADVGSGLFVAGGLFTLVSDDRNAEGLGSIVMQSQFQLLAPDGNGGFAPLPETHRAVLGLTFIPEPGTGLLIAAGIAGIAGARRRA